MHHLKEAKGKHGVGQRKSSPFAMWRALATYLGLVDGTVCVNIAEEKAHFARHTWDSGRCADKMERKGCCLRDSLFGAESFVPFAMSNCGGMLG